MEVSIIITNFNYGIYIERCLRSCLNQNFNGSYEIIVIDDCSTDLSSEVLKEYENEEKIRIIFNKENVGVAESANKGIRAAKGQFVVRVDADDYVNEHFIFLLSIYLRNNAELFCVACDYYYVDNFGKKYQRLCAEEKPVSCGIMYRKDTLLKHGLYNSKWRHREEEELRKRVGSQYQIGYLRIPLYRYRKHGENKTEQKDIMEVFRKKLSKVTSLSEKKHNSNLVSNNHIVAIIPARAGSKRLERKNIIDINGKPMIQYAIDAALSSKYISKVFVSTESSEISSIAKNLGAQVITRPKELADDSTIKQEVIVHAVKMISKESKPDVVVSLQANSPQITSETLDDCINQLYETNTNEVMTVDENMAQNAAVRVMRYDTVFQKSLSTYFSIYVKDLIDVHTKEDLQRVQETL
jgi:glycosyltransferase involved in cell wall biosynthesis